MMFREKGKRIVCLRSEYSKETQRSYAVQVASFEFWREVMPDDVRALLTDDEFKQYENWRAAHEEQKHIDSLVNNLKIAHYSFSRTVDSLANEKAIKAVYKNEKNDKDPLNGTALFDQEWADKIFTGIADVRKALKKAGFKPSPKDPKNEAVVSINNEPVDSVVNEAVDNFNNVPVDNFNNVPVDSFNSVPVDSFNSVPVDVSYNESVDSVVDKPVDSVVDKPVDSVVSEPVDAMAWFDKGSSS